MSFIIKVKSFCSFDVIHTRVQRFLSQSSSSISMQAFLVQRFKQKMLRS